MKLREVSFNQIRNNGFIGLCIMRDLVAIQDGFIGEVLRQVPHLADCEVYEQHPYFDQWVITLRPVMTDSEQITAGCVRSMEDAK